MNNRYPPGQIMLLIELHCFVFRYQIRTLNGSPAAKKFMSRLLDDNMITPCDSSPAPGDEPDRSRHGFMTTDRGKAYLEKLCHTDLPVLVETWV